LDRSPAAAKKLASRARGRLVAGSVIQPLRVAEHLEIVEAFLAASRGGDIATLLELLAPDVVRRVDRALVPADVATELRGARKVAEETRRFAQRARAGVVMLIDGVPGIVIAPSGLSPGGPSQQHHRPVRYQGRRRQPGGIPATGKEEHSAR